MNADQIYKALLAMTRGSFIGDGVAVAILCQMLADAIDQDPQVRALALVRIPARLQRELKVAA